jgi:hypothetical protein
MPQFTITITCETRHAIAIGLLRRALTDAAQRFKMLQRFRVSLEKTTTGVGEIGDWGFTVKDVTVSTDAPALQSET